MKEKLKAYRESRGLSVAETAKLAEIKAQTYYKYEAGLRVPSRRAMLRIAKVLGASVEALFFADSIDHKSN